MKAVDVTDEPVDDEPDDEVAESAGAKKKKKKKKAKKSGEAPSEDAREAAELSAPVADPVAADVTYAVQDAADAAGADEAADGAVAKKKKKKKGGGGGGGGGGAPGCGSGAAQPTEDAQARFQAVLDALRSSDGAALLGAADLSHGGVGDKKLRQLLAALRGAGAGCALTTLDLSHNSISDAGAGALCAALGAEDAVVAPRLVLLALPGNAIGEAAGSAGAAALASRPALSLVLPEQARPAAAAGGDGNECDDGSFGGYFSPRATDAAAGEGGELVVVGGGGGGEGEDAERPLLSGRPMSLEAAIAILEKAQPATAGSSIELCDGLATLLAAAAAESVQLAAGGTQNAKFLPRALKWCATHTGAIGALLGPSARPRVSYGATASHAAGEWGTRLGRRRWLLVQLLTTLIGARRPPLTNALAEAKPSLLGTAVSLLARHPTSSVLGGELRALVDAACNAKPLRASMLANSAAAAGAGATTEPVPSVQSTVARALIAIGARPDGPAGAPAATPSTSAGSLNLHPAAAVWLALADSLERLGAADKQVAERLGACAEWRELLGAELPRLRALAPSPKWACGDPPHRPGGEGGGEMGELMRMLQNMPQGAK